MQALAPRDDGIGLVVSATTWFVGVRCASEGLVLGAVQHVRDQCTSNGSVFGLEL